MFSALYKLSIEGTFVKRSGNGVIFVFKTDANRKKEKAKAAVYKSVNGRDFIVV